LKHNVTNLALGVALCAGLLCSGAASAAEPYTATLKSNRNRLFADWAARNGQSANVCQAWQNLSCAAKGAFITLTHRLQISVLPDGKAPLDHVDALYAINGDPDGDCHGGDDNRLFASMDDYLWEAMAYANIGYVTTVDTFGNPDWQTSSDPLGPHDPFDASNETAYGHPRGQVHFWITDDGFYVPVYRNGVNGIIDANMLEFDQDYDWNHPSSTECSYDTGGCDQCQAGTGKAGFSSGPGRMIYARQHPFISGMVDAPNYDWAPAGCERSWCNGCKTCEAETATGYKLGYPATRCSQVVCDANNVGKICTLDGAKKSCANPGGWVTVP